MSSYGYEFRPYVPVAVRRRKAEQEMQKLRKKGHPVSPVVIEGRKITRTFWGNAWCDNLEHYSDFENRLPRGRTYVRNGSVVDLQIAPTKVTALVSGSEIYKVEVKILPISEARWTSICTDCAGAVDSLVELLQGRFSQGVMERICQQGNGLFPTPQELKFSCSCPDWASMCKHVAATLYGVGARLDTSPELLFRLREVDEKALLAKAAKGIPLSKAKPAAERVLESDDLANLFGLELGTSTDEPTPEILPAPKKATKARAVTKTVPKRATKAAPKKEAQASSTKTSRKPSASATPKKTDQASRPKTTPKTTASATPKKTDQASSPKTNRKPSVKATAKKTATAKSSGKKPSETATGRKKS
jgi:uncharacterized Zn finger protein